MQITIDDQVFTFQRYGGVSRYFAELIKQFRSAAELGVHARTPFRYVLNEYLLELDSRRYRRPPLPSRLRRGRLLRRMNSALPAARRERAQIVHHTFYFTPALQREVRARICTIYDMIPELFPELFPGMQPHAGKDDYVHACDALLCISETTKTDLLARYGSLDKPVVVTPLGVTDEFFAAPVIDVSERPYVLFVGQRDAYKNFDVLLRALSWLTVRHPRLELICVGGPPLADTERERIDQLGLTGQVSRTVMDDAALPAIYAAASCFVFPSRYEGFGLPIVEAFAAGCPVLLADTPCSVEIGGAAAQFFPPDGDEQLAEAIDSLVGHEENRATWIAAGRVRARDYTWRRTAELTAGVYQDLDRQHPA